MKTRTRLKKNRPEAGVALIIALFVLVILSVLAASIMLATQTETWSATNNRSMLQARYAAQQNTGGDIAKNGNANLSAAIGGSIYVPNTLQGACPDGVTSSNPPADPGNNIIAMANTSPPVPAVPPPGATDYTDAANASLAPGSYHNITMNGKTPTLSAGTYNINCISVNAGGAPAIGSGPVVLNVTGSGCPFGPGGGPETDSTLGSLVGLSGGSIANCTGLASNLQINVAATSGNANLSGAANSDAVTNAPDCLISFSGGSDFYGAATGLMVNDSGGTLFHYDRALSSLTTGGQFYPIHSRGASSSLRSGEFAPRASIVLSK